MIATLPPLLPDITLSARLLPGIPVGNRLDYRWYFKWSHGVSKRHIPDVLGEYLHHNVRSAVSDIDPDPLGGDNSLKCIVIFVVQGQYL